MVAKDDSPGEFGRRSAIESQTSASQTQGGQVLRDLCLEHAHPFADRGDLRVVRRSLSAPNFNNLGSLAGKVGAFGVKASTLYRSLNRL
jgi:hypothetical protein